MFKTKRNIVGVAAFLLGGMLSAQNVSTTGGFGIDPAKPDAQNNMVNYTGAFTYSYPIEIPEGVHKTTPKISINYSSSAPNDMVGVGFYLSFMSQIVRDSRYPINLNSSDHYQLDGQKLLFDSTNNTYHFERETYEPITVLSVSTKSKADPNDCKVSNNSSDTYWLIKKKDGTSLYYGSLLSG